MFRSKEDAFVNLMRLSPFRLLKNLGGTLCLGRHDPLTSTTIFGSSQKPKIILIGFLKGDGSLVQSILGPPGTSKKVLGSIPLVCQVETPTEPQLDLGGGCPRLVRPRGLMLCFKTTTTTTMDLSFCQNAASRKARSLLAHQSTHNHHVPSPHRPTHQQKHKNKHHGSKAKEETTKSVVE